MANPLVYDVLRGSWSGPRETVATFPTVDEAREYRTTAQVAADCAGFSDRYFVEAREITPPPPALRRVLIVDQFDGPSPYELSREPMPFTELVEWLMGAEHQARSYWKPRLEDVPEDFTCPWAHTLWTADQDGNAVMWKAAWDSSD